MQTRLFPSFVVAAALAVCCLVTAAHATEDTTIKFSDPAKPGTVRVILGHGNLRVRGADVSEISVRSDAAPVSNKAVRKDGLRVLTSASSYALVEKDNVVTLDAISEGGHGGADFTVVMPRSARLSVQSTWGGANVTCADLDGDLDIKSNNGDIKLERVGGGVLVETMNGKIVAGIRELRDNKPLSFTTMNGDVFIHVAEEAKANIRFRTQNGSVLTAFPETALVTKNENSPVPRRTPRPPKAPTVTTSPKPSPAPRAGALTENDKEEIRNGAREAAQAVKEASRAADEAIRQGAQAAKEAMQATQEGLAQAGISINLKGSNFSIPTISGGQLVTGTLNGGGPEISVSTMSGDIKLLYLEKK
jgi:hypothetical protein